VSSIPSIKGKHIFQGSGSILKKICWPPFADRATQISAMAFDASWRRLLIGGEDGSLRMWNFNNGQCLKEFLGFGQVCNNKGMWEKVYSLAYYWAERS